MRWTLSLRVMIVSALATCTVAVTATVVRAGQSIGLSGRTHLVVKEQSLKQLHFNTGVANNVCGDSLPLFLVGRTGLVSSVVYTVPRGAVFVVTDVRITGGNHGAYFTLSLRANGGSRWPFVSTTGLAEQHFTGGLAFDPEATVDFLVQDACGGGGLRLSIDLLGYETADVP
ncbi:MAG: hypothetical protein HYR85_20995 [Planctomycetes bacterium]|nr:hypothetical protein [Planctomycetota bacterium]MBI3844915.1 hypothetical protein [Planctomycetota bacterium]